MRSDSDVQKTTGTEEHKYLWDSNDWPAKLNDEISFLASSKLSTRNDRKFTSFKAGSRCEAYKKYYYYYQLQRAFNEIALYYLKFLCNYLFNEEELKTC